MSLCLAQICKTGLLASIIELWLLFLRVIEAENNNIILGRLGISPIWGRNFLFVSSFPLIITGRVVLKAAGCFRGGKSANWRIDPSEVFVDASSRKPSGLWCWDCYCYVFGFLSREEWEKEYVMLSWVKGWYVHRSNAKLNVVFF